MNILVINAGSSSFKYQLIDMSDQHVLCSGLVERIGEKTGGRLSHKIAPGTIKEEKIVIEHPFSDHVEGMKAVIEKIIDPEKGVVKNKSEIHAIGHRVVMGGEAAKESVIVNEDVKRIIRDHIHITPLHNPANLAGIEVAEELFPGVPNVAVFDTEFHQTMPKVAYLYPLPYEVYEKYHVRRYGFHGTSHRYVTRNTAKFLGKSVDDVNLITCHLGNGCSLAAIRDGKCVDTTMGMTPLDGLMMGTRCGSIDPAIIAFLVERTGKSLEDIDFMMNMLSGLKGICGHLDMRDIHAACDKGDDKAILARDMFVYRVKKCIGAYMAVLGRVDALVFTAGIGENDVICRSMICEGLEHLGIVIDPALNAKRSSEPRPISPAGTPIPVLIVPTNEELEIALTTARLTAGE